MKKYLSRLQKNVNHLIAVSVSVLALVFSVSALADVTEQFERTISMPAGSEFSINNINGSVSIEQWGENAIRIVATKRARAQDDLDRMIIDVKNHSHGVSVETKYQEKNRNNNGSVDYKIMLPHDIKATEVDLVNGSLSVVKVSGDFDGNVVNGSIKVKDISGNGQFNSVNGSVKITYQSLSDSVDRIRVSSVNGSIKLSLPSESHASVSAETMHGSLKSDFNLNIEKALFSGKSMTGKIGTGGTKIKLETVNGSIKVIKS